jgi:Rieske Fe-S protein
MDPAATRRLSLPMIGDTDALDRRGFLEQSVRLAAMALLAGSAACSVNDSLTGPSLGSDVTVNLADYPALAQTGGVARISGVSPPVAVANLGDSYMALSLVCTHQGGIVQWDGNEFVCPIHGARFADDGHWTGGTRTSALRSYPVDVDATTGTLTIHPRG